MSFLANLFGNSLAGQSTYRWATSSDTRRTNVTPVTSAWEARGREQIQQVSPQTDADRVLFAADYGFGGGIDAKAIADHVFNNGLIGTPGNDRVRGTSLADRLRGDLGNDHLNGGPGDDFANGNQGDDLVFGGQGNDQLLGGKGNDRVSGDLGNDILNGNLDDDILIGGAGADQFRLSKGNDVIEDFNLAAGDVVAIVANQSFSIRQQGADLAITREGYGVTTLLGVNQSAFEAANPIVFL